MFDPRTWRPIGWFSLIFAPANPLIAAIIIGEMAPSDRAEAWEGHWIVTAGAAALTSLYILFRAARGQLIKSGRYERRNWEKFGAAMWFVAGGGALLRASSAQWEVIVWGALTGFLVPYLLVANIVGNANARKPWVPPFTEEEKRAYEEDTKEAQAAATRPYLYQLLMIPAFIGVAVILAIFDVGLLADEADIPLAALVWAIPLVAASGWFAWGFDKKKMGESRVGSIVGHMAEHVGIAAAGYLLVSWIV